MISARGGNGNGGAAQAQAQASRMNLAAITRGKISTPLRELLYGTEGVGKSTYAASAELPIYICPEQGTAHLDVARFPEPRNWSEVVEAIRTLIAETHTYKTLVVDTLDWLEPLLWRHVCEHSGKPDIEAFGYGKGYVAALDVWREFLAELERLRRDRGMTIVLLAHAQIRPFRNPEGDDFDRYTLKLHEKAAGLIKEWCDLVLFANYETFAVKKDGHVKGVSSGARVVHTQRTAAWDAKNRHDLPETLPLSWDDVSTAIAAHRPADPAKLRDEIAALAATIADADLQAKVAETVAKAKDDAAQLARIKDRLAAKAAQKEA